MSSIVTVCGFIRPEDLGRTMIHEHLFVDLRPLLPQPEALLDDEASALDELLYLKQAGGQAVVEVSVIGMGRNPIGLRRLGEVSSLHIIAGTGFYLEPMYPPFVAEWPAERLADLMAAEVLQGIKGSGVRAGVIGELGFGTAFVSPGEKPTPLQEKVLEAAARAHRLTGTAITLHAGHQALDQLAVLDREQVELDRVIFGHADGKIALDDQITLARRGANLAYDCFGKHYLYPDRQRIEDLLRLLDAVGAGHLMLSQDVCLRSHWRRHGGFGYDHVLREIIPALRTRGVRESEIDQMLVKNPARVLAF
ncbi:MAG: phosphotriesterase-related protein [Armatimonadetes bacterium]|nr:phosphotriesterase-related protein [Armatimonadota bacterium]